MGGFSGAACERSNCPQSCSGHGHCRSMSDFAEDYRGAESIQYLYDDVSKCAFKFDSTGAENEPVVE